MGLTSVLVTGANRGIGLEFVKQFLAQTSPPQHVFATCRQPAEAKELQILATENNNLHVLELELKSYATHEALVGEVRDVLGDNGLDVLVNNAGVMYPVNLENGGPELLVDNFEVNAVTPFMLTRAFLPLLRQAVANKRQPIVANITSKMGSIADNDSGSHYAYRASKTALNCITKSLSVDLGKEGIICLPLHPGWVLTDMGGPNALIDTKSSVAGLINVITTADKAINGKFLNFDGTEIPW
jgi:NAD(P)-dependent dehydrogenase (short-subunit alcohol dehydrogenase family)